MRTVARRGTESSRVQNENKQPRRLTLQSIGVSLATSSTVDTAALSALETDEYASADTYLADALPQLSPRAQLLRLKPRQEVVKVPRPKVSENFAIALMRSNYNALAELKFFSEYRFQKEFFFSRQKLLGEYQELLRPIQMNIGSLSDPYYFDFISLCQFDALSTALQNASDTIEEFEGAEGNRKIIRRDTSIPLSKLPSAFADTSGKLLLQTLSEFEIAGLPDFLPPEAGLDAAINAIFQLARVFELNGYAARMNVSTIGSSVSVEMEVPATVFGMRKLIALGDANRTSGLVNDHFGFAASHLLRQYGFQSSRIITPLRNSIVQEWKIHSK